MTGQSIAIRTLALVLAALAILFTATKAVAGWYEDQRQARSRASFQRGTELARAGHHEEAIERFRNALVVARGSTEYRLALAQSLMSLGRRGEAAIQLQEVLRADPARGLPNLLLARIAAAEGRTDAAVVHYQRAIFGYWLSDPETNRVNARWELTALFAKTGQAKQVIAGLLELADTNPDDDDVQRRVARMLIDYDSPTQAAEISRTLFRDRPSDYQARTIFGEAQLAMGNYFSARDAFRRALNYNTRYDPARKGLSVANEVLSLDPTLRGLGAGERIARSRKLASRALAALEDCIRERLVPPETAQLVEQARQTLGRATRGDNAVDINTTLAEQLWQHRADFCGPRYGDAAVAQVLARIAK